MEKQLKITFGRTCRIFTKAEINALLNIKKLKGNDRKIALDSFCKQYNRTIRAALVKMYNLGYTKKQPKVNKESKPTESLVNEIIVPIKAFKVVGNNLHITY